MKRWNVGALRLAPDDLRAGAAADLVQRTLAQHGLGSRGTTASVIADALANAGLSPARQNGAARTAAPPALPAGASFERASFAARGAARDYLTYVPASAANGAAGIVVMLHGCTQTPGDFAHGTGMNAHAERHRLIVIYPEQARGANAQSCWNWFSRGDQARGRGEPEIIAGLTQLAMEKHDIAPSRTFVAGLSAGAAMAAILGHGYPDVYGAVGAHSGLPIGAAHDVPSAFAAMAGQAASARPAGPSTRTIVLHGSDDRTVHPSNGAALADIAERGMTGTTLRDLSEGSAGGRSYRRVAHLAPGGRPLVEHWVIDGLGHAWSGGRPGGSYTDPAGPDASAEMIRFFLQTDTGDQVK